MLVPTVDGVLGKPPKEEAVIAFIDETLSPRMVDAAIGANEEHVEHCYGFCNMMPGDSPSEVFFRHKVFAELRPIAGAASVAGGNAPNVEADVLVNGSSILVTPVQIGGEKIGIPQDMQFISGVSIPSGAVITYMIRRIGEGVVLNPQINVQFLKGKMHVVSEVSIKYPVKGE